MAIDIIVECSKSQTWNHDVKAYRVDWDYAIGFDLIGMLQRKNTF